jgi:hypothetical protein
MASLIQSIGLLEHPLVAGGLPPSVQQQGEPVGLSGASPGDHVVRGGPSGPTKDEVSSKLFGFPVKDWRRKT